MKQVIRFESIDGRLYESQHDCERHERLIEDVDKAMSLLKPKPVTKDCSFGNGHGYLQQKPEDVITVRRLLLEMCAQYNDHKYIRQALAKDSIHLSWVCRILEGYNTEPILRAINRLLNIGADGREWGQQCFVEHPERAEQFEIV